MGIILPLLERAGAKHQHVTGPQLLLRAPVVSSGPGQVWLPSEPRRTVDGPEDQTGQRLPTSLSKLAGSTARAHASLSPQLLTSPEWGTRSCSLGGQLPVGTSRQARPMVGQQVLPCKAPTTWPSCTGAGAGVAQPRHNPSFPSPPARGLSVGRRPPPREKPWNARNAPACPAGPSRRRPWEPRRWGHFPSHLGAMGPPGNSYQTPPLAPGSGLRAWKRSQVLMPGVPSPPGPCGLGLQPLTQHQHPGSGARP